jgi:undecaprenyl diphosphate synthase
MSNKDQINLNKLPNHIAIIMDGNGRWAKGFGKFRIFGHHNGVKSVKTTVEAAAELGVKYVTLYTFSTENWNRPKTEVDGLMELLVETIKKETPTLQKNNIRLKAIGNIADLPPKCQLQLQETINATKDNKGLTMVLALSYSAKWDLVNAVKRIAQKYKDNDILMDEIDDSLIDKYLSTSEIPHPELLIRTSGEQRISNFLLWELAYAEFYFTDKLWPDFGKEDLYDAILNYQNRERRFGKISEQLTTN